MGRFELFAFGLVVLLVSWAVLSDEDREVGVVWTVTDGDTFVVEGEVVRLVGVDAPELDTQRGVVAREMMVDLLLGVPVELFCDVDGDGSPDVDRYGRRLCLVEVGGVDVGGLLVESGLARRWR